MMITMSINKTLGTNLRKARYVKGLSLKDLSDIIKEDSKEYMSVTCLHYYESSKRNIPLDKAEIIAGALDRRLEDLLSAGFLRD